MDLCIVMSSSKKINTSQNKSCQTISQTISQTNQTNQINKQSITKTYAQSNNRPKNKSDVDDMKKKAIIDELVNKFNLVVINMIRHITDYYCDTGMSEIQLVLEKIIIDTPDEPIACFIMNIYKVDDYRHNILEQNDKFFLDELDDVSSDASGLSDNDRKTVTKMFEFKDLWYQIDDDTKCFIKKSMMTLVKICQKYILSL